MKIYLAGPMRGYPQYNFPLFIQAAYKLREFGHDVRSPAEHDIEAGFDFNDPTAVERFDLDEALAWDIEQVRSWADAVVCLPGWTDSKGTAMELDMAELCGKAAYEYDPTGRIKFRYGTSHVIFEPDGCWPSPVMPLFRSWRNSTLKRNRTLKKCVLRIPPPVDRRARSPVSSA